MVFDQRTVTTPQYTLYPPFVRGLLALPIREISKADLKVLLGISSCYIQEIGDERCQW